MFPLLILLLVFVLPLDAAEPNRQTYNFNPGWKLETGDPAGAEAPGFDDSSWRPVTLPHAWNEDAAFKEAIYEHPTGIAWYRKHFKLPAGAEGGKIFVEFEGIRQGGEIYLNGKWVGRHENGVTAAGFDLTPFVKPAPEENILAVRTNNAWDYREVATKSRYQWSDKNFNANFGGIPRNVRLHITGKLYQTLPLYSTLGTTGVYIHASDFEIKGGSAVITTESEVRNEDSATHAVSLEVIIEELDGKEVARFASASKETLAAGDTRILKASAKVSGLKFWSWGYGYLYSVRTALKSDAKVVDEVATRSGFRKAEFGHGMIRLNERIIQIHGYGQRTSNEWPALGNTVPPWLSDFSNGLMVESNGNLVRWMHTAPSRQDVESCDRVGLMQAMPAGDAEGDVTGRRWEQRAEAMRDAIIYYRNNPSILLYEGGNAGISEEHMAELKALRDRFDPAGGRAIGARNMLGSRTAEYGGDMLYINKSARNPFWATEYSRDEGLRKYWDELSPPYHKDGEGKPGEKPAPSYNHNQDSHAVENVARWYDYWKERPGTGTRVNSGGVNIIFSDSNTHFRGSENYRTSGEVDAMRIPKDGFFAHQVMWDGWVDVEKPRAYIIGHWNYAAGVTKDVKVVSSADEVELFLNGKSLGRGKQSDRFLFTFEKIAWKPGTLLAVGKSADGRELCRTEKHTAGSPVSLKLSATTAPGGLKADGADIALVQVEVMDQEGNRCPTALDMVNFDLQGPAEWRGGIAVGPDNYILSKSLPVEGGVNRVLIRSLPRSGKITLTANADKLAGASVTIDSKPVDTKDGLGAAMPDAGLLPGLSRGPTPSTPSFKVSRITIPITRADAGANGDKAALSFDDNEDTSWSNDDKLATAWISYELARSATLTEIGLKLSGWRQRRYPIRITVDGQEVYKDVTPLSLGYVTLPLKAVRGKSVRIELLSAAVKGDGFDIEELANPKNAATGDKGLGKGSLGIVEVDCFEATK